MAGSWRASRVRTANLFKTVIKRVLKKPEKLTVSQWAERFRILDESSNFSGKWSNDITPYMIGVMDAFNDPYIQEINFVRGHAEHARLDHHERSGADHDRISDG